MTRLPMLAPADLDDQQRALYDAIAGGPRVTGPRLFALTVAAHWDSAFERYAHEAVGRAAGLTDEELRSLRAGEQPRLDDPAEQTALDVVRALLRDARASAARLPRRPASRQITTGRGAHGVAAFRP